jgi:hypothetical protein
MSAYEDLFELPISQIDFDLLHRFVATAEQANALVESKVVELKLKASGKNIAEAVAAFSNTDGGIVLVGLDESKRGDERFVGVTVSEHDAIVAQLHDLIREAMPDVLALAIPDASDRLVVILRVNADSVRHPVVVSGRVLIRIPGHTVPADHDAIIRLAHRDDASTAAMGGFPQSTFSPANCELWKSRVPLLELRTFGSVRLPASVRNHAWFGTQAKESVAATLASGPLPDSLWHASPIPFQHHPWLMTDARATWFRLESEARPDLVNPNPILTAVQAQIAGQDLTVLVAVALLPQDDQAPTEAREPRVALDLLNEALATTLSVHAGLCRTLADELDAGEPMSWYPVTTQMTAGASGSYGFLDDVIDLNRWDRDTSNRLQSHLFPSGHSPRGELEAIDRLTHEWLNLLLLDVGARHFEAELASVRPPAYLE